MEERTILFQAQFGHLLLNQNTRVLTSSEVKLLAHAHKTSFSIRSSVPHHRFISSVSSQSQSTDCDSDTDPTSPAPSTLPALPSSSSRRMPACHLLSHHHHAKAKQKMSMNEGQSKGIARKRQQCRNER